MREKGVIIGMLDDPNPLPYILAGYPKLYGRYCASHRFTDNNKSPRIIKDKKRKEVLKVVLNDMAFNLPPIETLSSIRIKRFYMDYEPYILFYQFKEKNQRIIKAIP